MKIFLKRFWKQTEGQDLVEYALLVAAIALALIVVVKQLGDGLSAIYTNILSALSSI